MCYYLLLLLSIVVTIYCLNVFKCFNLSRVTILGEVMDCVTGRSVSPLEIRY